jgi:hypothetical protein
MFRVAPLVWLALVFLYWLAMTVVSLVPVVGIGAATVLIPGFSVGFMVASRAADRGQAPQPGQLLEGFRHGAPAQLTLGGIYLVCLALLIGATALADGGALARWLLSGERPDQQALHSDAFLAALLMAASGYLPVMMMFWFAPVLVAWHGMAPAKALFFSFFGSLVNWRAFIGYGLIAALVTVVLPFLLLALLLVLSAGRLRMSAMGLVLPLLVLLLPTLFASFYASYRDVFGGAEESA